MRLSEGGNQHAPAMMWDNPSAVLLMGSIAALSSTVYGIAALWAISGRGNWLWRVTPLALLLAAMAPIGAYELLAMFAAQCALVIAGVAFVRWVNHWRAARRARAQVAEPTTRRPWLRWPAWQFGLFDLLKAVVLTAVLLALVRLADPTVSAAGRSQIEWRQWLTLGLGLAFGTLGAAYLVGGAARWYLRAIVCVLLLAADGALAWQGNLMAFLTYASGFGSWSPDWSLLFAGVQTLLTTGWLLLVRAADYSWRTRTNMVHGVDDDSAAQTWNRRRRGALLAGTALVGLSLLGVVALGNVYWALLPEKWLSQEPLPEPNGYAEVLKIGATLSWTAVPNQDYESASVQACQQFTRDNAVQLTQLREAFGMPSRVPVVFNDMYISLQLNDIQMFREIMRGLAVEGKAASGAGRTSDAVRSYLDSLHLSRSSTFGGLIVQDLVGIAVEGIGIDALVDQFSNLDMDDLGMITRELEARDRQREPLELIIDRDRIWTSRSFGWSGRLWVWVTAITEQDAFGKASYGAARARIDARVRLTLTEAAVRRFAMTNGSPPQSLESLVPEYLSAVPQDPYGDGPLVYRCTPDGYLLYSVAANATDDGGKRVSSDKAIYEVSPEGDLFFDAKYDTP